MEITQTLHVTKRSDWRNWLRKNYKSAKEIWLVYDKKHTGRQRISYNDAVEEALCFGWIDSTAKSLDEERMAQRFTPRRPGRPYSQANKERLRGLVAAGKVAKEVKASLVEILSEEFKVAPDILKAIQGDPAAWKNYQAFSDSYKRIRVAFIEGARDRPKEFQKRLNHFIRMTAKNKMFGYGGIDKYY